MKIILDAMGGDNAPDEIVKGAAQAVAENRDNLTLVLVGNEEIIRASAAKQNIALDEHFEIVNTTQTIEMCDEPAKAIRAKKDSSMVVSLRMLAEGKGDAFVSAGSTGALHVGASLIVRTIKGVKRPALATVIPGGKKPYLLMDRRQCGVPRPHAARLRRDGLCLYEQGDGHCRAGCGTGEQRRRGEQGHAPL